MISWLDSIACIAAEDIRCYLIIAVAYTIGVAGLVYFEPVQYWAGIQIDWMFWVRGIAMIIVMFVVQGALGHKVVEGGMKVGYSRKIGHFMIHGLPALSAIVCPSYKVCVFPHPITSMTHEISLCHF